MADTDWGSLTSALIPAGVGLVFGGLRGGALGAATGVGAAEENRIETEKFNINQRMKQQEYQLHQQNLELNKQQFEEQKSRNVWLNRHVEDEMKTSEQGRQERAALHQILMRDDAFAQKFFEGKPPEEYVQFMANKPAWATNDMNKLKDADQIKTAALMLKGRKALKPGENGEDVARLLGRTGLERTLSHAEDQQNKLAQINASGAWSLKEIAARRAADNASFAQYIPDLQSFATKDKDGKLVVKSITDLGLDRPVKDELRVKATGRMMSLFEKEKANNQSLMSTTWSEWIKDPDNELQLKVLSRDIPADQQDALSNAIAQRRVQDRAAAASALKAEWMSLRGKTPGPETDAAFTKFLNEEAGKDSLKLFIQDRRDRDKFTGGKEAASAAAPAAPKADPLGLRK